MRKRITLEHSKYVALSFELRSGLVRIEHCDEIDLGRLIQELQLIYEENTVHREARERAARGERHSMSGLGD